MELFDYQIKPYQELTTHLETQPCALVVMATGLGKTWLVGHYVHRNLLSRGRGLVLCHDANILSQIKSAFEGIMGESTTYGVFSGEEKMFEAVDLLFATFQTFTTWKHVFDPDEFVYIIVDEAHHGEATTFSQVIRYFHPSVLIGMTATPDRMDGRDIRDLFGEEVVHITLEEAIAEGWLTPVEYHLTMDHINAEVVKKLRAELNEHDTTISMRQLNRRLFIERRDEEIAHIIQQHNLRGIIFCTSTDQADIFATLLPHAESLHSKRSRQANDETLTRYQRRETQYLTTVDKFNEGIDIPDLELLVFLRATESLRIFLQQLGRGLRRHPGKQKVIVLDFVGNCDRILIVQALLKRVSELMTEQTQEKITLKGIGHEFIFDDLVQDVLDILTRMKIARFISDVPEYAREFHPTLNQPLTASDIPVGTAHHVWWKCQKQECGHEWKATGTNRIRTGCGCPACAGKVATASNSLRALRPDLVVEFHPTKNHPITPDSIVAGSAKKVWWTCSTCHHEWEAICQSRTNQGTNCPACAGQTVTTTNSMRATHPELTKEFHPTKNAPHTPDTLLAGTYRKLWWKCQKKTCGYEWITTGTHRVSGTGCPACANKVVTPNNCLCVTHPELAKEFHPTKNTPRTPDSVVAGTNKKLWWKCQKSTCAYEWQSTGANRIAGKGCPACAGIVLTKMTCLRTTHPDLAAEFHPTKNDDLTPDNVMSGSSKRVWWICRNASCQHEWVTQIRSRIRNNSGCPKHCS